MEGAIAEQGGPLLARLGIEFVEASAERVVARMPVQGNTQPYGILHGGASMALAETALAAQLWGEARRHLTLAAAAAPPPGPSRHLCRLMARLEEGETGNTLAARAWLDRAVAAPADPCYVCAQCGEETAEWRSQCRQCGGFDTLAWRRPPAGSRPLAADPASAAAALMLPAPELPGAAGSAGRAPSGLASSAQ